MATDYRTLVVKRGSADDWAASTVPLMSGEWGYDETNRVAKMGDGFNLWAQLTAVGGDLPFDVETGLYLPGEGAPIPSVDVDTQQLPDDVRARIASNLADPATPEGAALAEVIASSGGGAAPLTYDATTGLYSVPDGSALTYDSASGLYTN